MKKRHLVGICTALLLAVVLCCSGCGGGSGDDGPSVVYVPEYTQVEGDFTSYISNYFVYSNDKLYFTTYVNDEMSDTTNPEYYDTQKLALFELSLDGQTKRLTDVPTIEIPEGWDGYSNVYNIKADTEGNIYLLMNSYTYRYNTPEGWVESDSDPAWNYEYVEGENQYNLLIFNAAGELQNSMDLSYLNENQEYFYVNGLAVDGEGNIYITSEYNLFVLNKEGEELFRINGENYLENLLLLSDGSVGVSYYGENGYQLNKVDLASKALGEAMSMPANAYNLYTGGNGEYDFYYTNGSNFFGYKADSDTSTKLLNWVNCDINSDNLGNVVILPDGRILCLLSEWNSDYTKVSTELAILTAREASSVEKKKTLTLATQYLNYDLRNMIIKYNRSNPDYRIEVLDYSEYNTQEDYSAGLTKLTAEIGAGNLPDILDLNGLPTATYAGKGLLEDLYPYIDNDASLSRDQLLDVVHNAMTIDGKLYSTCSGFGILTVIGASSVVGDEIGWTMDEFKQAYAQMPEGCTVFDQYVTRPEILQYCLAMEMDSLVDWSTGECNFDSQAFIDILEFANSFPSEFDWENYNWEEEETTQQRLASGKQMLMTGSVYDFEGPQQYELNFGTDITYIGFPVSSGSGNMISATSGLAMSSKCSDKDAAWQFLRQFFTEDYQINNYGYGFPTNKAAFDAKLEEAMTPQYELDASGNPVLDENGNKVEIPRYSWGDGTIEVNVYALTQEEADQILELINTTTRTMTTDQAITEIVTSETEAYFAGSKSAEETAKMVQSRVSLYVNEQR